MAIEIQKQFRVGAPVARVWRFLNDLERVAECLEGARITGRDEDGAWSGTMKVKLGPVSSTYEGTVRFVRTDEGSHTAELSAEGRDTRGKGAADMTMRSELTAEGNGTEVSVSSTVHVTGVLARMGRGMIADVSDQLFERFTACARRKLENGDEGPTRDEEGSEAEGAGGGSTPPPGDGPGAGSSPPADEALQLGGIGARAGGRALARALRRPLFWVLVALVALAVWAVTG